MKIETKLLASHLGIAAALAPIGGTRADTFARLRSSEDDELGSVLLVEGWGPAVYYQAILPADGHAIDAVVSADAIKLAMGCHHGQLQLKQTKSKLLLNSESRATNQLALAAGMEPPNTSIPSTGCECSVPELQALIRSLGAVCSDDLTRPHLCLVECDGESAWATDCHMASRLPFTGDFSLPSMALRALSSAISSYCSVTLAHIGNKLAIWNQHMRLTVPVERPKNFPVPKLFEMTATGPTSVEIESGELLAALEQCLTGARASSMSTGQRMETPALRLTWGEEFTAISLDESTEVDTSGAVDGPEISVIINAELLKNAVLAASSDVVTLHAGPEPTSPLVLSAENGARSVIMPRVK